LRSIEYFKSSIKRFPRFTQFIAFILETNFQLLYISDPVSGFALYTEVITSLNKLSLGIEYRYFPISKIDLFLFPVCLIEQ